MDLRQVSFFFSMVGMLQYVKEREEMEETVSLQQNVFLVKKISEEIFFVTKNTALVTKYEFRH